MPYKKVVLPDAKLESIFSCVKQPVYISGPDFKVIYANSHAIKLVGKTKLNTDRCYEIFHPDGKVPTTCPLKRPACDVRIDEQCICKKGNTENSCYINAVPIQDSDGKVIAAVHMLEITTEQVRLAEELLVSNQELQLRNEFNDILTGSLDLCEILNAAIERLVEWSDFKAGAVFVPKDDFIEMKASTGLGKTFVKTMKRIPIGKGLPGLAAKRKKTIISENAQLDIRARTDQFIKEKLKATISLPIIAKDQLQGVLILASNNERKSTTRDIKFLESIADQMAVVMENANLHQKTIKLSRTDNLTGLFNSRYFEEILQRQLNWSKRKNLSFALLMLDIDNLKRINDLYGHDSGDTVLKKFSQIMRDHLRETDFYARYGGDEFVVLLPDIDEKMAMTVANKVKKEVAKTAIFGFDDSPLMTTSIGIAIFPGAASTMVSLIKAADLAMYRAKQDGKNRICIFEPGLLPDIHFNSAHLERLATNADFNAIQTLVTAVDLKDRYTGGHSAEVSRLAVFLAQRVGIKKEKQEQIRLAALLHDVGKIGISDTVLLKPHKLTEDEFGLVKKHPQMGVSILKHSKDFKDLLPIVLHHHERWDGTGYPKGLSGKNIPLHARIIAIADAFEAMTSDRPYRKAMTKKKALSLLWKSANTQFDADLVKAFTAVLKELEKSETGPLSITSLHG